MAASSEEGRLAVNGMSCFARDAVNSNSALLVGVSTDDYGGGGYSAPAATVGSFLYGSLNERFGRIKPSYSPSVKFASPEEYLPDFVCESLRLGIRKMGCKIKGFDDPDAVLTGIESRSSSPVRINRGEDLQSVSLDGLYPCGEGAGYAGGIVSAAVDGMKCAEAVIGKLI